jgi:hypothetical protein
VSFLLFLQHLITMLTCNVLCSYRPHSWREDLYSNKAIKYTTFNHTLKHCFFFLIYIYIYIYIIVLEQLTIKQGTLYSFLYNSVFYTVKQATVSFNCIVMYRQVCKYGNFRKTPCQITKFSNFDKYICLFTTTLI